MPKGGSLTKRKKGPQTLDTNRLREVPGTEQRGKNNCSIFIRKETKKREWGEPNPK